MNGLLLVAAFVAAILLGVPIGMSMMVAALVMLLFIIHLPLLLVPQIMMSGLTSFELLAVPLFIFAAEIMNAGGLTRRIQEASLVIAGRMPGGLAQVNIVATLIFSGISGSAIADSAGLGRIQIRSMQRGGYDVGFAGAIVAASCVIGPMIPPSIIGIIYAIQAQVSVGRMLLAGVLPGLVVAASLMTYVWVMVKTGRIDCPPVQTPGAREGLCIIWRALPAIMAPAIILAGLIGGLFTITDTGTAACVYSLVVAMLVYRELTWKEFARALERTVLASALVMFMIGAGTILSYLITLDQSLLQAANWFGALPLSPALKLLLINLFLLVVGAFIEGIPAMLILIPVLLPVAVALGVDPLHFGVILILNLALGLIHPPLGLVLFIVSNISGVSVERLTRAIIPFLIPLLVALLIITYVPWFSTWLPNLLLP